MSSVRRFLSPGLLTATEYAELDELCGLVEKKRSDGKYEHWTQGQRDRVRELLRRRDPSVQFTPSTEEMARRFGHLSRRAA